MYIYIYICTNTSDRIAKIRNRHIIIHFGPKIDLRQLHLEDFLLACNDALALVAHDCRTTADLTEALPGSSHGFPQVAEWIETAVLKLPFPKHKTTAKGIYLILDTPGSECIIVKKTERFLPSSSSTFCCRCLLAFAMSYVQIYSCLLPVGSQSTSRLTTQSAEQMEHCSFSITGSLLIPTLHSDRRRVRSFSALPTELMRSSYRHCVVLLMTRCSSDL